MSRALEKIVCRHRQQQPGEPDIVLAVGEPVPGIYAAGRPEGAVVTGISAKPYRCTLDRGDDIWISEDCVTRVVERAQ